ncbi:MAG: response regulator transcription factor [Flavobacterium sp.]|nr:response regulator transcription factor [Candidatus Neoflavobacterium equi]
MNPLTLLFTLIFGLQIAFANPVDPKKLEDQISKLNDQKKYEESLIIIDDILNDENANAYDKYNAYLQKAFTYKRVYNYTEALENLEQALLFGKKSSRKLEVETRVLVENIFIQFDLRNREEAIRLLKTVKFENLEFINRETKATYLSTKGIIAMDEGEYINAEHYFDDAITILKKENPKHLPSVYRAKIQLYYNLKDNKKAMESYELGKMYAEKYNVDIYKIIMLESLTQYYVNIKNFEKALETQQKVSEARTKYNAANESGKLTVLEKKLIEKQKALELENEKHVKLYYISLCVVLTIILILSIKLLKANRIKSKYIHAENEKMREELEHFIKDQQVPDYVDEDSEEKILSERQLQIIELVKNGKTNKEIGQELFISENTVKYHLKIIYDVLKINNRAALKPLNISEIKTPESVV